MKIDYNAKKNNLKTTIKHDTQASAPLNMRAYKNQNNQNEWSV